MKSLFTIGCDYSSMHECHIGFSWKFLGKTLLFLILTERKDSRMMSNYVWKIPNAFLFIPLGDIK